MCVCVCVCVCVYFLSLSPTLVAYCSCSINIITRFTLIISSSPLWRCTSIHTFKYAPKTHTYTRTQPFPPGMMLPAGLAALLPPGMVPPPAVLAQMFANQGAVAISAASTAPAAVSTAAKKKKAEKRRVSCHRCGVRGGKRWGGRGGREIERSRVREYESQEYATARMRHCTDSQRVGCSSLRLNHIQRLGSLLCIQNAAGLKTRKADTILS